MKIPKPTRTPCHISAWRWNLKMLGKDSPLNPGHSWEFALWECPRMAHVDVTCSWNVWGFAPKVRAWRWTAWSNWMILDGWVLYLGCKFDDSGVCAWFLLFLHPSYHPFKENNADNKGFFSHWGQNHQRPTGSFFPCWSWGSCGNLWMCDHYTAHAKQGAGCPGNPRDSKGEPWLAKWLLDCWWMGLQLPRCEDSHQISTHQPEEFEWQRVLSTLHFFWVCFQNSWWKKRTMIVLFSQFPLLILWTPISRKTTTFAWPTKTTF